MKTKKIIKALGEVISHQTAEATAAIMERAYDDVTNSSLQRSTHRLEMKVRELEIVKANSKEQILLLRRGYNYLTNINHQLMEENAELKARDEFYREWVVGNDNLVEKIADMPDFERDAFITFINSERSSADFKNFKKAYIKVDQ